MGGGGSKKFKKPSTWFMDVPSRLQYHIIEHFPFTYLDISEIKNDEIIPMPCCQNLGEIHLKKCIFREEKISRNFTYFGQMHIKVQTSGFYTKYLY